MTNNAHDRIPLDDLLVFHQLARSLTSSFDLDTILRTILEHMERIIEADLWTLLILDQSAGELYYALAAGGEQEALRGLRVKVGEGPAGWVAEHGETLIVANTDDDPRLRGSDAARKRRVQSVIALPLRGRKGTHGVIEIVNPHADQMNDYTIAFLHILADHAAIAIENANDVTSIQQLTITDDCTGLFNARHLYHVLDHELKRSAGQGSPVSLAFLDLDRFKDVNDVHGHLIGSELLAHTGRRLQQLSRPQDVCFRYGGDEFVILMPDTTAQVAMSQASSVLSNLMDTRFRMKSGISLRVRASLGIATAPADGGSVHAIIGTADSRMYAVKSNGRGLVRGA
jgi:diguanylate cyclase (GGDEF)-like protein